MELELPVPVGEYLVGLTQIEFGYRSAGGEDREISVTLFYPASPADGMAPAPYAFPEVIPALQLQSAEDISAGFLTTRTHAYTGAALSEIQPGYPLVLFNHGYLMHEMSNTVLCSDLASCGYLVASVSHPGETAAIRYSDGRIRTPYPHVVERYSSGNAMGPELVAAFQALQALPEDDTQALVEKARAYYSLSPGINRQVGVWAEDTMAAVDVLEQMNRGKIASMFAWRLRLDLGYAATGHSFGGTTAAQVCRDDPRCSCGIDIDGGLFGNYYDDDIRKPFLTLGNPHLWKMNQALFVNNSADVYHLAVLDATHMGFTDMLFTFPEAQAKGLLGERDPMNLRQLVTEYHLRFFDRYLLRRAESFGELDFANTRMYEKRAI